MMKKTLVALIAATCAASAFADASPVAKPEKSATCPGGYHGQGMMCIPANADTRPAIARNKGDTCPAGYNPSGAYFCLKGSK